MYNQSKRGLDQTVYFEIGCQYCYSVVLLSIYLLCACILLDALLTLGIYCIYSAVPFITLCFSIVKDHVTCEPCSKVTMLQKDHVISESCFTK